MDRIIQFVIKYIILSFLVLVIVVVVVNNWMIEWIVNSLILSLDFFSLFLYIDDKQNNIHLFKSTHILLVGHKLYISIMNPIVLIEEIIELLVITMSYV